METHELTAALVAAAVAIGAAVVAVLWNRVKAYVARTAVTWDDDLVEALEDAAEEVLKRRERKVDAQNLDKSDETLWDKRERQMKLASLLTKARPDTI